MIYKIILNPTTNVAAMQAVMNAVDILLIDVGFFEHLYSPNRTYEKFREHLDRNLDTFAARSMEVEHTQTVKTKKVSNTSTGVLSFMRRKRWIQLREQPSNARLPDTTVLFLRWNFSSLFTI